MNEEKRSDILEIANKLTGFSAQVSDFKFLMFATNPTAEAKTSLHHTGGQASFFGTLKEFCDAFAGNNVCTHYCVQRVNGQPTLGHVKIPIRHEVDLAQCFWNLPDEMRTLYLTWPNGRVIPDDFSKFREPRQEAGSNTFLWSLLIQARNSPVKDFLVEICVCNAPPDVTMYSGRLMFLGHWLGPIACMNAGLYFDKEDEEMIPIDSISKMQEVMWECRKHNVRIVWPMNQADMLIKQKKLDLYDAQRGEGGSAKQKDPAVDIAVKKEMEAVCDAAAPPAPAKKRKKTRKFCHGMAI